MTTCPFEDDIRLIFVQYPYDFLIVELQPVFILRVRSDRPVLAVVVMLRVFLTCHELQSERLEVSVFPLQHIEIILIRGIASALYPLHESVADLRHIVELHIRKLFPPLENGVLVIIAFIVGTFSGHDIEGRHLVGLFKIARQKPQGLGISLPAHEKDSFAVKLRVFFPGKVVVHQYRSVFNERKLLIRFSVYSPFHLPPQSYLHNKIIRS